MVLHEFIRHGDATAAVIDILINHTPEFAEFESPVKISGNLIGWSTEKSWIMVSREGGTTPYPFKADRPRIDIVTYAPESTLAFDLADVARASILRARGTYSGYGIRFHRIVEEVGPTEVWDKQQETPSYFMSLRLTTTPDPSSMPSAES